jgi:hypothetical protein
VGKPERDQSEDRGVDGIRMYLREIGLGVEWIQLAQDRDMGAGSCEYGDETSGSSETELVN